MVINIDLTQYAELLTLPAGQVIWRLLFWYFGWLPVAITMVWGVLQLWLHWRQEKWAGTQKLIILAIDIPQNNIQSPRAVENLFTYLHGAHKNFNLMERWWDGMFQWSFGFEIVSIEGYIQFIITCPSQFKNLVETAVYAQYPDAEITEVEDYTADTPEHFPDRDYDLWGSEIIPVANQALPIKLYQEFEHQFGPPEMTYRDPMASLMDLMSSLKKGEQLWFQMVVKPADFDWTKKSDKEVGKILGEIKAPKGAVATFSGAVGEILSAGMGNELKVVKKEAEPLKMMQLKPAQKKKIEAIQLKASKIGFEVKIRAIYFSKKDVMNKPKVVNGFFGWVKQFQDSTTNSFKPDSAKTMTNTAYFRADERSNKRKNRILRAYKGRSSWLGHASFIMTTDELATMWHFPIDEVVKAPLVQRAAARRVEPPMRLPMSEGQPAVNYEAIFADDYVVAEKNQTAAPAPGNSNFLEFLGDDTPSQNNGKAKDAPPDNLPFV